MKVNKSEYRIGNLVHHVLFGTSRIIEIRNDGISIANPKNYSNAYFIPNDELNRIEPIPITEEWLIRFGFDRPANSWIGEIFHLSEWDDYPLNWCVAFNKNNAVLIKKLKYIHQLQNLYFALTGQ